MEHGAYKISSASNRIHCSLHLAFHIFRLPHLTRVAQEWHLLETGLAPVHGPSPRGPVRPPNQTKAIEPQRGRLARRLACLEAQGALERHGLRTFC